MDRYFAYGSNLNLSDLEKWCQRIGRPFALSGKATAALLPDHETVFDYLSESRRGGVLDLRPAVGKVVPGALFDVVDEDLKTLDLKEGVPLIYRRARKRVLLPDGREVEAAAYEVAPEYRSPGRSPPQGWPSSPRARVRRRPRTSRGRPRDETPFLVTGLFVYGTLLRAKSAREFERCRASRTSCRRRGSCSIAAPSGMVPDGGTVHGEVIGLRDVPRRCRTSTASRASRASTPRAPCSGAP
jgi:gamma-glutamylcyclotransferase (GGCT)/AIG2-like uncharacterized protein YtfP